MKAEEIFKQGSRYADENWDINENPNEHDNAREDFIAGALWARIKITLTTPKDQ